MEAVLELEAHPGKTLTVLLFKNVKNAKELRAQLVGQQLPLHCALLQAQLVPDLCVLASATHTVLVAESRGKLMSKALHSDIVVNLSGSTHVAESLKRFGITDETQHLLVARLNATAEEVDQMKDMVQGEQVAASELGGLTDEAALRKLYKITPEELATGGVVDAVLCRMAARDCSS